MKIIIKTMEGLEEVLAQEVRDLHLTNVELLTRGVSCEGTWAQLYKCNYLLRTAIRVLVPIKDFTIETQEDLYTAVRTIDWSEYIKDEETTFMVGATVFGELFTNSRFVTYRTKDAIVDQLSQEKNYRPNIELDNPDIVIQVRMAYNSLSVLLDSSGKSLHLRNYKERAYKAPLNEVMAAGILKLSGWDLKTPFYDPMCGSGTFTTEALMMASHVPAGKFIERFCFQNWSDFREDIWKNVKESADALIAPPEGDMYASDINPYAVRDLKKNLQKLQYSSTVQISEADFLKSKGEEPSVLFINPPYDKRIQMDNVIEFYRLIGDTLKTDWQDSEAWVVSGNNKAMKNFGLRSASKHRLDNGGIATKLYKYELYGGSRKTKHQNKETDQGLTEVTPNPMSAVIPSIPKPTLKPKQEPKARPEARPEVRSEKPGRTIVNKFKQKESKPAIPEKGREAEPEMGNYRKKEKPVKSEKSIALKPEPTEQEQAIHENPNPKSARPEAKPKRAKPKPPGTDSPTPKSGPKTYQPRTYKPKTAPVSIPKPSPKSEEPIHDPKSEAKPKPKKESPNPKPTTRTYQPKTAAVTTPKSSSKTEEPKQEPKTESKTESISESISEKPTPKTADKAYQPKTYKPKTYRPRTAEVSTPKLSPKAEERKQEPKTEKPKQKQRTESIPESKSQSPTPKSTIRTYQPKTYKPKTAAVTTSKPSPKPEPESEPKSGPKSEGKPGNQLSKTSKATTFPIDKKIEEPKSTDSKPIKSDPMDSKPVEPKPVEPKPTEELKAVESKPTVPKNTEAKTIEPKALESKAADAVPTDPKAIKQKTIEAKPSEPKPSESKPTKSNPKSKGPIRYIPRT